MSDLFTTLRDALAGRYAVERELGRGGMATVFLAQDLKHHRPVAVKVVHPEFAAGLGADRFLREIEIAARLQHPHILPLYDSGEAGGFFYYVMPYVEGESLRDRLNREKQLSLEDTLRITVEVASALTYAHSHGVVHRDIKPENVMISGGHAVVADFGIARAVTVAGDQALTQTGTVVGTPAYMSPEQATGSEIDGRSDQYSLACVAYEMLVGEPPFTGATPQAVMARHSLATASPPSIVRNTISAAVEQSVMRALAKVPADRFATAALFAEAMAQPSAPTTTTRATAAQALGAGTRRRIGRWALGAGVVVIAVASAWAVTTWWPGAARKAAPRSPDPRSVAVLYFRDLSPGQQLGFLADGITEALIDQLGQVGALQVTSRSGVRPYKGADLSPDSVGRALNVGTLVEGTVAQSDGRLRVSVSLVNATTGTQVGSKTLERPRTEIFQLQDELASEVAVFLRQRMGEAIQLQEGKEETRNAEAWELVQQAKQLRKDVTLLLAAGDTAAAGRQLARADTLLSRAAALDGKWARPVIERGWVAHQRLDLVGTFDKEYYSRWIERGLGYAEEGLKLKAGDADALELRGTLRYYQWAFHLVGSPAASALVADAEGDLRGAVEANPDQAAAWALLSHLLMRKSQPAEAKLAALHAYEADPYLANASSVLWRLYSSSLDLEDGVEAARWCDEGYRRFPREPEFTECQITQHALPGRRPDAPRMWRLLDENVKRYPPNAREYRRRRGEMLVAMTLVRAGLPDSARRVALRARADATIDPSRDLVYIEAMLRNMLGDRDEALSLVGTYLATNPQDRATMAKDETWWWRGLRDDPRFQRLVGSGGRAS
ncbi:MAG TPA: protein kinase [Gemmatimonadales bacterium]|nr:protein kinase [Gemmatimonadales bacterium]